MPEISGAQHLLDPLGDDLAAWRQLSGRPGPAQPLFPSRAGGFWRETDWRNWRKRVYAPVAEEVGLAGARPYDLRHAFASLLIHEGRLSVVEIAAQRISAEEQILMARGQRTAEPAEAQLSFPELSS